MILRFASLFLLGAAALLATACSSAPVVPASAETTDLVTLEGTLSEWPPTVLVVVADDATTADAATLRQWAAESVRGALVGDIGDLSGECGDPDPAAWHPLNLRVMIARPSAPDAEVLLTPLDVPALALVTETTEDSQVDAVVAAVTGALGQRLAQPGDVYRPLRAAQRALELVTGSRPPDTAAEEAVLASVPAGSVTAMLVASTRDDEDTTPVAQLVPSLQAQAQAYTSVAGPFTASAGTCRVYGSDGSRLATWAQADRIGFLYASTCTDATTWDALLELGSADCFTPCWQWPLPVTAEGVALCTMFVDQADLSGCDASRGWQDPGGQPTLVDDLGATLRRCEVVQLTGAALQSCREELACSGCGAGWCATDVAAAVAPSYCDQAGEAYAWPLRYLGGAISPPAERLQLLCDVASGS